MYLREMGCVPLLTVQEEIVLSIHCYIYELWHFFAFNYVIKKNRLYRP
ncbi:MAG: hypothetical protein E6J34_16095 [Chloroflexi bacterium]|nr:MAG: hypothetical protein E6J34_16095 [Chloroflexota bacterium]